MRWDVFRGKHLELQRLPVLAWATLTQASCESRYPDWIVFDQEDRGRDMKNGLLVDWQNINIYLAGCVVNSFEFGAAVVESNNSHAGGTASKGTEGKL